MSVMESMEKQEDLTNRDWLAGLIEMMADHDIITFNELIDYAWRAHHERKELED